VKPRTVYFILEHPWPGLTLVRITRNSYEDFRELSSPYDQPNT